MTPAPFAVRPEPPASCSRLRPAASGGRHPASCHDQDFAPEEEPTKHEEPSAFLEKQFVRAAAADPETFSFASETAPDVLGSHAAPHQAAGCAAPAVLD